ncbi:serine/threonine-protein kinase [Undibacterium luofuense]|uniref:Serine/threonine protein kinase n=1 Tax=Undibacterium luofuense TaxID=2828733 RepID=A0A941I8K1_9BURK|nr:serine/threonine-protein kinase [Undibacterium luofuense]MBR7783835.1 serine/threonine protein kinase [Undibacterium luofuense]
MTQDYIRVCPGCLTENSHDTLRCQCGMLLTSVDLSLRSEQPGQNNKSDDIPARSPADKQAASSQLCPHEDCAQPNPPDAELCLYCNRPLAAPVREEPRSDTAIHAGLWNLPPELKERYSLIAPLPASGGEADLLLLRGTDHQRYVLKLYRHGNHLKSGITERLAKVPVEHRVHVLETGTLSGRQYELMEYCEQGSLRQYLQQEKPDVMQLRAILLELDSAVSSVHQAGLLHRDLKPENILIRTKEPLDLILTDFGIASALDATQKLTGTARTLHYAAPETLSGVISAKADYWALGMILLEAITGRHPFNQFSEAVILHQLATREIDLNNVADKGWKKLLRGLLLRDPAKRWASAEILRWLANDPTLPEPVETQSTAGFREPFHIGADICHTKEQLGVALARNWALASNDLANGLLLQWFRDVQKDQNAVRLLLDNRHDRHLSVDVQLLQLILYLSPGLPPVWRGESVELSAVLLNANRSLKGEKDASVWLHALYHHKVLDMYAQQGDTHSADLAGRWYRSADEYLQTWHSFREKIHTRIRSMSAGYVNVDKLMFSDNMQVGPNLLDVHAKLLACAYDARWADRLRKRLQASYAGLAAYCPWLQEIADLTTMSSAGLLVMDALIPDAEKAVEQQKQAEAWQAQEATIGLGDISERYYGTVMALKSAANATLFFAEADATLHRELETLFALLTEIREAPHQSAEWLNLKKHAAKTERVLLRMAPVASNISERMTENAGWLGAQALIAGMMIALVVPMLFNRNLLPFVLLTLLCIVIWRLLPVYLRMRQLRELAALL